MLSNRVLLTNKEEEEEEAKAASVDGFSCAL
jgi:hypothetical protein